ncbi:hypothetical protein Syun_009088 [Stephania yunnanensis]|uniref:Uncharacterized protein n=1 Tax=Stephania yunnanensis TaxID=152371 RepID=A0AAP0KFX8_9MAGN
MGPKPMALTAPSTSLEDALTSLRDQLQALTQTVSSQHDSVSVAITDLRTQILFGVIYWHKKKEREATKQGKRPLFTSKNETGKLESVIERRLGKNASKDRRFILYRRWGERGAEGGARRHGTTGRSRGPGGGVENCSRLTGIPRPASLA